MLQLRSTLFSSLVWMLVVPTVSGFASHHSSTNRNAAIGVTALHSKTLLSNIDRECILNTGTYCLENGCDLDDIEALINQLQDQHDLWKDKLDDLEEQLHILENANQEHDRNVDFLTDTIRKLSNVFKVKRIIYIHIFSIVYKYHDLL